VCQFTLSLRLIASAGVQEDASGKLGADEKSIIGKYGDASSDAYAS
jgi:hypothetical protein